MDGFTCYHGPMKQTLLSVNINKIALLRNSRGDDRPNLLEMAKAIIGFGAQGITVHPRPDARHITYDDVRFLKYNIAVELNVEGYPSTDFLDLVLELHPSQVTLVPDPPDALTSSFGWDVATHEVWLTHIVARLKAQSIRTALFIDPTFKDWKALKAVAPDRIELYTHQYAKDFALDPNTPAEDYRETADQALQLGIALNAGHDLNQANLKHFLEIIPEIKEVSIGHALICEALLDGLKSTIKGYLTQIQEAT